MPQKAHPRPFLRATAHSQKLADANGSNRRSTTSTRDTLDSIDLLLGSADDGDKPSSTGSSPAKGDNSVSTKPSVSNVSDEPANSRYIMVPLDQPCLWRALP